MTTKRARPEKADLVEVEWLDAHGNAGWQQPDEIQHHAVRCWTVGWMFKNDEAGITVASSVNAELDVSNTSFVPQGMIKKVTVLKKARKKR